MQPKNIQTSLIRNHNQTGATLIEILIAVLLLSLGLLGMAGMQSRALKGNHSSNQRTQAVLMSYYILDAMRVDRNGAIGLAYNTGSTSAGKIGPICNPAAISGMSLASNNMRNWITTIKANIGEASDTTTCGAVNCTSDGVCQVQIKWDDTRAGGLGEQMTDTGTRL